MIALLALLVLGQNGDEGPTPAGTLVADTVEREWVDQVLEDGRHQRFGTADKGPVHVWRPKSYQRESAAIVVYVHGFYVDVDQAMLEYDLPAQFRDSGRNALFIVPETRSAARDPLWWTDLEALLKTVEKRLRIKRPPGPIIVVSHSGGYRTVMDWLKHPDLTQVLLVDGMYGGDKEFKRWIDGRAEKPRQFVMVGYDTETHAEWFLKQQAEVVRLDDLPYLYDELTTAQRNAPVLYLESVRYDHMAMVTTGRLVPWLLHALR